MAQSKFITKRPAWGGGGDNALRPTPQLQMYNFMNDNSLSST